MYISLNTGASGCELQVKNKQYYINIGFDEHEQHRFKIISSENSHFTRVLLCKK